MKVKFKSKTIGPVFVIKKNQEIRYALSDVSSPTRFPPSEKPSQTLLASVGACFAKSIDNVAQKQKLRVEEFIIQVKGFSSIDVPIRIAKISVLVSGGLFDKLGEKNQLLMEAKVICTVSNTLNCDIELDYD